MVDDPLNDLLMSGGGKTAKFETVGTTHAGVITSAVVRQVRNFQTGEPETWSDGNPVQQFVITIQTNERDPLDPDDDGIRNLYVKAYGEQKRALQDAIRKAGSERLEIGATLVMQYVADGQASQRGFNPPKLFAFAYTPPQPGDAVNSLLGAPAPVAAPVAATPAPVAAPVPVGAAVGGNGGGTPTVLGQLTPDQIQALLAQAAGQQQDPKPPF